MSDLVWAKAESRRTAALRKKEEREAREREAHNGAEQLGPDFAPLPASLRAVLGGECTHRVTVPVSCVGLVIGKKGEHLKEIQQRYKVSVKVEDQNKDSKVAVVTGKSPRDVMAASRDLDFVCETVDMPPGSIGWASGKGGCHLAYVREISGVAALRVQREGESANPDENDELEADAVAEDLGMADGADKSSGSKRSGRCWFELRGQRETVVNARLCLEAHLSYYPVYQEMESVERQLDQDLANAKAMQGHRPGFSRNRNASENLTGISAAATANGYPDGNSGGGAARRSSSRRAELQRAQSRKRGDTSDKGSGRASSRAPAEAPRQRGGKGTTTQIGDTGAASRGRVGQKGRGRGADVHDQDPNSGGNGRRDDAELAQDMVEPMVESTSVPAAAGASGHVQPDSLGGAGGGGRGPEEAGRGSRGGRGGRRWVAKD
mmetsp:Transcript_90236/g.254612  ORF Transcript_90236/g.254612 Transcript_90236/m.254612 type:complete len:436 (-) Transcript_90236:55-1362(-)